MSNCWMQTQWKMLRSVLPVALVLILCLVLSLGQARSADVRYESGDGTFAGTTLTYTSTNEPDWKYPNDGFLGDNTNVACSTRLKVKDGSAAEKNIWIPFNPKNYRPFKAKHLRVVVQAGNIFIRPFYSGVADTTLIHIISSDSTVVGWSVDCAGVDSLRFWSDDDTNNWVDVYAR